MWDYKQSMGLLYAISLVSMFFGMWLMYEGATAQTGLFFRGVVVFLGLSVQLFPIHLTMALTSGTETDEILNQVWKQNT